MVVYAMHAKRSALDQGFDNSRLRIGAVRLSLTLPMKPQAGDEHQEFRRL